MSKDIVSLASVSGELIHSRQWWTTKISDRWQDSVQAVIDVGRMLIQSKKELPHGEFGVMCEGGLPFSWQTANKLMKISKDDRITNYAGEPA